MAKRLKRCKFENLSIEELILLFIKKKNESILLTPTQATGCGHSCKALGRQFGLEPWHPLKNSPLEGFLVVKSILFLLM